MNTWKNQPIYSFNTTVWIDLMNRSTQDWSVGYFPSDVVAIPGSPNDITVPPIDNTTLVIAFASNGISSGEPTAQVIYSSVSAISIFFTAILLWHNWKTMLRLKPPESQLQGLSQSAGLAQRSSTHASLRTTDATADDIEMGTLTDQSATAKFADMGNFGTSAALFREMILRYFYEPVETELELCTKKSGEDLDEGDIEAVISLARRALEFNNELSSHRNTLGYPEAERQSILVKRKALTVEIEQTTTGWARAQWQPDERRHLTGIIEAQNIDTERHQTVGTGTQSLKQKMCTMM